MKKKLLALFLVALMIMGAVAPLASAGMPTSVIKLPDGTKSIYVRSGPGTNYAKKGYVTNGQEVDLLKIGTTWTQIRLISNKVTGYIKNAYIADLEEPVQKGAASAAQVKGSAYLHIGPHENAAKLTVLGNGTKLKVWGTQSNWKYVTTLGTNKTGWIYDEYVAEGFTQVTTTSVHLRHGENGRTVATLKKNTTVNVIAIDGSWSEVSVNGTTGYVYSKYLK